LADTADILAVADGKLDPAQGFMQGKAKVKGGLSEALELVAVRVFERYAPGVPKNPMIGLAKRMSLEFPIVAPQVKQAGSLKNWY
jgi:hypothetical protein